LFHPTGHRIVDLADEGSRAEATIWWEQQTANGSEGMVVKPLTFVAHGKGGRMLQGVGA
jgi:protein phosphatase